MSDYFNGWEEQSLLAAMIGDEEPGTARLPSETSSPAPVREIYRHVTCDTLTYSTGNDSLKYKLVYCSHCMFHHPVNEFELIAKCELRHVKGAYLRRHAPGYCVVCEVTVESEEEQEYADAV